MKTVFKILMIGLLLSGCALRSNSNQEVVAVVTKKENLDKYVGKRITVKGEIFYKFIPTIIGVDVSCINVYKIGQDLNGKKAVATGVLTKTIVKEIPKMKSKEGYVTGSQNRGVGTFYALIVPENDSNYAEVKLIGLFK